MKTWHASCRSQKCIARDIPHSSRPSRRQRVDSVEGGLQLASRL